MAKKVSKANQYIVDHANKDGETCQYYLHESDAFESVRIAEKEMRQRAIEVLSSVLENWVHGGDADCIVAEFEERLDN